MKPQPARILRDRKKEKKICKFFIKKKKKGELSYGPVISIYLKIYKQSSPDVLIIKIFDKERKLN